MFKAIIVLVVSASIVLLTQLSFAETCPSVSDIKKNALKGWKAYDSDEGTPLSYTREVQFKNSIKAFALAEWTKTKGLQGSIRCYYRDQSGSSLEAYLSKDNFIPKINRKSFWYQVSGSMHCAADKEHCQFQTRHLLQHQFAKK